MILVDDDSGLNLDSDTAPISGSASLEIRADAVLESSKPADPTDQGAWSDIEDGNQRPLSSPELDDLAPPHSPYSAGLSYPNPYTENGKSQCRLEDRTLYLQPTNLGVDDERSELALLGNDNPSTIERERTATEGRGDTFQFETSEESGKEDGPDNHEDEDYSHDTSEGEEEDLQPLERQTLPSQPCYKAPSYCNQHNAKLDAGELLPLGLPTLVGDEQVSVLLPSQGPSSTVNSETTAKYEEWPIHGFLKGIRIGRDTDFNLEFRLEEPQPAAPIIDPNHQWEIRKIIGQKMVGREKHYRVEWKETWMPESELAGAEELVEAFMTEVGTGTRGRKRPQKRSRLAAGLPDAQEGEPKKRRGRPRKQT